MKQPQLNEPNESSQLTKLVPADSDVSSRFQQVSRDADVSMPGHETDAAETTASGTVSGRVFLAIPEAIAKMSGSFEGFTRQLLADAGLTDIRAEDWYPQSALVTVLDHLRDTVGGQTVERLGRFLPTILPLPDAASDARDAFQALDDWYRTWNRGDGDTVAFSAICERQATLLLDTAYPVEFERGIVRGILCQFDLSGAGPRSRFYEPATVSATVCRFTFGGCVVR